MKIGTKSLLFGVHQIIWHPICVLRAWVFLYGRPSFKELVCIIIHDWGYIGKPNLDGKEGTLHPRLGAEIAYKLFGGEYAKLCFCHSRSYIKYIDNGYEPSKLCWADKLAFMFDPYWFYILRAKLSGELKEIRQWCADQGYCRLEISNRDWYIITVHNTKNMIIENVPDSSVKIKLLGYNPDEWCHKQYEILTAEDAIKAYEEGYVCECVDGKVMAIYYDK